MNKGQKNLLGLGVIWVAASLFLIFVTRDGNTLGIIFLILGIALACFAIFCPQIVKKKKQNAANQVLNNDIRNSQAGDAVGLFEMGLRFYNGDGVEQNYKKAYEYWLKSAEKGDKTAQYNLGIMIKNGEGVDADDNAAYAWFQQAADQGHSGAINEIGVFHRDGKCGFNASDEEAFLFFEKAAIAGNKFAQYNIGIAYLEGRGCEENRQRAINFLSRSAEQDHKIAEDKIRELIGDKSGF